MIELSFFMTIIDAFQASRVPAHDVVVLPGDELLLECDYETVSRPTPTFGGTVYVCILKDHHVFNSHFFDRVVN